jgi:SAM-dependent methyltransferase
MTAIDPPSATPGSERAAPRIFGSAIPWIYVLAVFCGAAMVFMVQPMVAKLVLPQLGGSPQVWNTSMAFFQGALLVGYGYAHFLQRIPAARTQVLVHLGVLLVAASLLPLRISGLFGDPTSTAPVLWLLAVLAVSIGAPFAALSATAPLVQAWHAKVHGRGGGPEPWALYAASNLGSLLALLAYPLIVEPTLALQAQRWGWSGAYGLFILLMAVLAFNIRRHDLGPTIGETVMAQAPAQAAPPVTWRRRLTWIVLAALPSSLMLGVTAHLTTDVASAPFLWVAPLSLYLLTFIIAFQTRPAINPRLAVILMSTALIVCVASLPFGGTNVVAILLLHLITFFLCALVCHQAMVARRPEPARLTDFYLCMSIGGVIGGAFNAFLAPVLFNTVLEYAAVLALCALVRPAGEGRLSRLETIALIAAMAGSLVARVVVTDAFWIEFAKLTHASPKDTVFYFSGGALLIVAMAALALRERAWTFFIAIVLLSLAGRAVGDRQQYYENYRSFFGVVHLALNDVPALGGPVRVLSHGTTLHGAQALSPAFRCRPLVYYAPEGAIGQVFTRQLSERFSATIGAVGLGSGAVAAYVRPSDNLTFFEIDPQVVKLSSDPKVFSYTTRCARGGIDYVLGDARLTLNKQPEGRFDILLIDAFSSDAIPVHLLTVEAMRGYLRHIKPDGVIILHLSNRHLELADPAAAVVRAAGGYALYQGYRTPECTPKYWASDEDVMLVARNPAALKAYLADGRWQGAPQRKVRPWTDDYTNVVGALVDNLSGRRPQPNARPACPVKAG